MEFTPPLSHLVITLLYATVSGKAEQLATVARDRLLARGCIAEAHNLAAFSVHRLKELRIALIITSSWGQGTPPPDALEFFHALETSKLKFPQLSYAVLALGSSSNQLNVGSAWRLDSALKERGARRLLPRQECERNDPAGFEKWLDAVEEVLPERNDAILPEMKLA